MYGKCKISYTKVASKMAYANSADPDQSAPEVFTQNIGTARPRSDTMECNDVESGQGLH